MLPRQVTPRPCWPLPSARTASGWPARLVRRALHLSGSHTALAHQSLPYLPWFRNILCPGDTTLRLWDMTTQTPEATFTGHTNWVLVIAWSPDGKKLASGGADNKVILWNPNEPGQTGTALSAHTKHVVGLSWEPLHKYVEWPDRRRRVCLPNITKGCCLASAYPPQEPTLHAARVVLARRHRQGVGREPAPVPVLDVATHQAHHQCPLGRRRPHLHRLARLHYQSVGRHRRTRRRHAFEARATPNRADATVPRLSAYLHDQGKLCRTLSGHGHWVNTLALNTDYVLRTGAFNHLGQAPDDPDEGA